MLTHFILSIHLGPCLDQHPACDLVATLGCGVERGELVLRENGRGKHDLGGARGVASGRGGADEDSDWGKHELGMDDLWNCQDKGAAHLNQI